jgi:DNA polymerase-3 subunit beta
MDTQNLYEENETTSTQIMPQTIVEGQKNNEFKIITRRTLLFKALSHIQSIVEKRNIIPILSNVKLVAKDNMLELTATDMDLAVSEKISADIQISGELTVPAHMLYDIVRKLPEDEDIELSVNKKDLVKLNIKCASCKFSLPYLSAEEFPAMDYGVINHKFSIASKDLADLIDKNRFSISTEETRYNLNGIYIHAINNDQSKALRAVATDGHRLSRIELNLPIGAENISGVILPRKAVMEIRKLIDNLESEVIIELSEAKIKFSFESIVFISKLIDGTFPDYEHLIPQDNTMIMKVDTSSFAKAVDRVSIITFEKLRAVKLLLKSNQLTITASGEASGTASEELIVEYNAKEIEIGFNSKYLLEILASVKGKTIEFLFSEDVYAPALIKDTNDLGSLYVIMPMLV